MQGREAQAFLALCARLGTWLHGLGLKAK